MNQFNSLTSLRGIAAVLVMFHNLALFMFPEIKAILPSRFFVKSYLWVDMFFLLSGFVLAHVYGSWFSRSVGRDEYWRYMGSRFARIYPLHILILVAFLGLFLVGYLSRNPLDEGSAIAWESIDEKRTLFTFMSNFILLQTLHWNSYWNEPAWSISAEWLVYMFVPFIVFSIGKMAGKGLISVILVGLGALISMELYFGDLGLFYAGWPMLVRCTVECSAGVVLYRFYKMGLIGGGLALKALPWIVTLAILSMALPGPHVTSVVLFAILILVAACAPQYKEHWLCSKWLVYLGTISYSVYMTHWLVKQIFEEVALLVTGRTLVDQLSIPQQFVCVLVVMLTVLVISHFSYTYWECPVRQYIKRNLKGAGRYAEAQG